MSEQPGRYQRSFSGMVGALLVLLLVVIAFVAFRGTVRDNDATPVKTVDYAEELPFIREEADFPVLAPPSLPDGWRATSLRFENTRPQSWHLGMLTDKGDYVGLEQSRESEAVMVDDRVDTEAVEEGPVTVAGEKWNSYSDAGGDYALVRRSGGVTTLVVGTLPEDELIEFVASLG